MNRGSAVGRHAPVARAVSRKHPKCARGRAFAMGDAGDVALSRLDLDGVPAGPLRAQAQFAQVDLFAER